MSTIDLNAIPLDPGVRLLEASAGTGKTFALAHLVLRLVGEADLGLRRLLVVTFTKAAATELRDRIGRRLQAALAALEHHDDDGLDPVLQAWLAQRRRAGAAACHRLRGQLLLALDDLDAADITTIHGYASRCLRRRPLEAGQPPDLQIDPDSSALIEQVVHDYWQHQVLPLGPAVLAGLARRQIHPTLLRSLLRQLDDDPALELAAPPADLVLEQPLPEQWPAQWQGRLQRFRQLWQERGAALEADLQAMAAQWKAMGMSQRDYPPKPRNRRGEPVDALLALAPEAINDERIQATEVLTGYFHPGSISRAARAAEGHDQPPSLPQGPLLEAIADLVDGGGERLLHHGAHWGRAELARRRARQGRCGYGQLLAALDPGPEAAGPTPLLRLLAAEHEVALIDEFQDTDPVQWRILGQAFGGGHHRLLMVGDPKQAIYSFRGGDLATYLAAAATASERFDLSDNRRSSPALVEGLNRLLGPSGLRRSGLAVPPVRARSSRSGPAGPPLELLWLGEDRAAGEPLMSATALEAWLPAAIARHGQQLLEGGLELDDHRPLRAADLCLLVGSHRQAEALRQALDHQAIPSRLISQADVLASPAATALQRLLDALADPADANRLRLLAASPLLAWDGATLAAAAPGRWSALAGRLQQLAVDLPRLGLLGVVVRLVEAEGMARLARGGRLLADLQQVSQLLEQRLHSERLGAAAAADWLRRQRLDPDRPVADDQRAHSERADDAVTVMTVHASKGLEFPVVICPYLWKASGGPGRGPGRRWQPPNGGRELDLHLNPHWGAGWRASQQCSTAAAAERERLAYVALTRAAHRLVLAWGPVAGQAAGPLSDWLLGADAPADDGDLRAEGDAGWRQRLEVAITTRQLPMALLDAPRQPMVPWRGPTMARDHLATGPVPQRNLRDGWGRASYSSWVQAGLTTTVGPAAPDRDDGRDTADPAPPLDLAPTLDQVADLARHWPASGPLAAFPRGAAAGDCLHRMLERLDYQQATTSPGATAVVADELARAALPANQAPAVQLGLEQLRLTPFGGALGGLRPADLEPAARLNEMGFDLSLGEVRAAGLAAAFADHPGSDLEPGYAARLAQLPIACRGYLTGSIDLVFRQPEGRWWVLDWKSNWLGDPATESVAPACGPRHYGPGAMRAVMASHHYPLQAHLYLVALHRYLGWRLPNYRPELHLGGYVYVFLRGTPGAEAARLLPGPVPGMVVEQPPLGRLLALDRALGRLEVAP
ncbi:MAG: UvrD-helicase domain-containing protein [Cyanobacteriota bacterium]|nr:UvrD-helicase domain-containing protein [Cyanobacteriota bacterium]